MPEGFCMCVWNFSSSALPSGTLCTLSWIGPRLALLPLISLGCSTPSARRRWSHAWPARLAWTTPCPTYLLLTCTVPSDTFVSKHTHTYGAACKPLQELRIWESRQPSPVAVYLLCHVREESRWLAPLSLEHNAVAVKPSSTRLKRGKPFNVHELAHWKQLPKNNKIIITWAPFCQGKGQIISVRKCVFIV